MSPDPTRKPESFELSAQMQAECEAFYADNFVDVRRYARCLCRDWHIADDLAHDALLAAIERWTRVREHERPLAWVLKTLRYKLTRLEDSLARRDGGELPDLADDRSAGLMADVDLHLMVTDLMQRLQPREAQAVMLCDWLGFTERQAAAVLDIALNTLKGYKHAGRQKLKAVLEAAEEGDA
jgi:RNA polymerase sigma-70 factor (ECF subfamily)